jgi:general secretion pathway protein I
MTVSIPSPGRISTTRARHAKASSGFSLLEALVAMAIASIALGTLYRTVGQSSKNAATVEERVEATLVARSVLASALYAEDLMRQPTGQVGAWHWRLAVQPDQAQWTAVAGRTVPVVQPVARVTVEIMHAKEGLTVLNWTTWKPYRVVP